tara:strand:- start:42 stop:500 length:459 start_codon:yes stop_codon:yes gene_type:complete
MFQTLGSPIMQRSKLPESNAFKAYRIFTAPDDGYYQLLDISYEGGDSNEYFTIGLFPPTTNADGDGPTTINDGIYWAMFGKIQGNIFNSAQKQGSVYQGYNSQLNYGGLGFTRTIPPGWSLWIWAIDGATTSEVITNTLACKCADVRLGYDA